MTAGLLNKIGEVRNEIRNHRDDESCTLASALTPSALEAEPAGQGPAGGPVVPRTFKSPSFLLVERLTGWDCAAVTRLSAAERSQSDEMDSISLFLPLDACRQRSHRSSRFRERDRRLARRTSINCSRFGDRMKESEKNGCFAPYAYRVICAALQCCRSQFICISESRIGS